MAFFSRAAMVAAPAASAAAFAAPSACAMAASDAPAAFCDIDTARAKTSASTASPKSSTCGSQTSSGNMGAAAEAGTSNPSIKHRRRRSSAARVPAPEICATPRSDSAAAAAAGSSARAVSSTSIWTFSSFSFSSASKRSFSFSASKRACLLRRSSLRFRRHASSSAPSKSTRRETRTSSGFRAPGGCSAKTRTSLDRLPGAPRLVSTIKFFGSSAHSVNNARAGPASNDPNDASTTFGPGLRFFNSSREWHKVRYRVLNALRRSRSKLRPTFSPIHSKCERANSMVLYATVVKSTSWYAPSCCLAHRSSSNSSSSNTRPAGSTGTSTFPSERTARSTAFIKSSSRVLGGGSPRALKASVMSREGRLIESSVVPFRCFSRLWL
mmetsp:Transcript_14263/g.61101  ORF Transcript_14263/g.61101 Transcript_14263/m.61101 type:complete len:383 (-) Transcript_14263:758-1906(-)